MVFLGELRVEATLENLRTVSHFLRGFGQRLSLDERTLFHLDLALEEAVTNVVDHAYPRGSTGAGEMVLRADVVEGSVRLTLTDWGAPLDPDAMQPFDLDAPVEARIQGGMGLHFIHSLMDDVVRSTAPAPGGPNTLTLVKHIERPSPAEGMTGTRPPTTLQELCAMLAVSQIVAPSADPEDLVGLILKEVESAVDAERAMLYRMDDDRGELVSRVRMATTGQWREVRVALGEGIAGQVALAGKALSLRYHPDDPRCMRVFDQMTAFGCRTILAVPMHTPLDVLVGVLQVLNKGKESASPAQAFTPRDERLLRAMATQAAIVIENARRHAQAV
jgi:anti-sigma regulatory factor (Ser/Thr protein kinase)